MIIGLNRLYGITIKTGDLLESMERVEIVPVNQLHVMPLGIQHEVCPMVIKLIKPNDKPIVIHLHVDIEIVKPQTLNAEESFYQLNGNDLM